MYLDISPPELVMELCPQCWSPYLAGKLEDPSAGHPHRRPPLDTGTTGTG
jgi:hypothetical protein